LLNSTNSFSIDLDEDSSITLPGFESEFDVFHGFGRSEEPVKSFEQRMNVWTGIKRFYIEKGIPKGDQVTLIGEFEKENNDIVLKSSKNIPIIIASKPLEQLLDYYGRKSRKYFLYGLVLLFAPSILSLIALLA